MRSLSFCLLDPDGCLRIPVAPIPSPQTDSPEYDAFAGTWKLELLQQDFPARMCLAMPEEIWPGQIGEVCPVGSTVFDHPQVPLPAHVLRAWRNE